MEDRILSQFSQNFFFMKKLKFIEKRSFSPKIFNNLLKDTFDIYVVRSFVPGALCNAISKRFSLYENKRFDPVSPPIEKIGWSFYEYNKTNWLDYFSKSGPNQSEMQGIFHGFNQNPLPTILNQIGASPLSYEGMMASFGVLRKWVGNEAGLAGLIHEDFLEMQHSYAEIITDWYESIDQLSVVLCFSNSEGGTTRIYNKRPSMADYEDKKFRLSYGFNDLFVEDVPFIDVFLKPGDLLIFRSSLLHSVGAVKSGERLTQQCFLNILENKGLKCWS